MSQQEIKKSLIALATIAGKELNEVSLTAYSDALEDLDTNLVLNALKNWLKTERGFPYPSDIRAKVMPEIDSSDDAQEVSASIVAAISKHGWTNPTSAKEHIGLLGWEVVQRMGGWKHLCESCTLDNQNTLRAQIRNYSESVIKRAKRGELDLKPALPQSSSNVLKFINSTFKGMEK